MVISVKRIGGYSGLTQEVARADTAHLHNASALHLEKLLEKGQFFELPARIPTSVVGADFMGYEITVDTGKRRHTVAFVDDESPETAILRQLVQTVTEVV